MEPTPPAAAPSRLAAFRCPARRAAVTLAALALAWVAAHAAADRAGVRALVRQRAQAALAARLPSAALGDEVSIDWLFRATVGPLTIPAEARGAPPVVRVERIKVRVAWLPLLRGRVEPASVRLYGVRLIPGPGGRELTTLVERLGRHRPERPASAAARAPAGDPVLHLRGLVVALAVGGRTVDVGPFDLRLERARTDGREVLSAELGLPGGGHAEAKLRRARPTAPAAGEGAPWSLAAHLAATAADLPASLRGGSLAAAGGALALEATAEGTGAGGRATLRGGLAGLVLRGAALGPEPVGPLDLSGEAELELSLAERRVRLGHAVIRAGGPLAIELNGAISAGEGWPFELSVKLPPVDYRALVDGLPRGLAPGPEAPRPAGAVGGALHLAGPLRSPEAWSLQAEVDLSGLRETARKAPPSPLRAPFTAHPAGDAGPALLLGPANPDFVPFGELPEHVVRAVTTSEDAGFFAHHGFDFDELRNALVAGARAGKLGRGGSTITQQLAKNLFLSRDRTLARKAREALITVALEGTVPKARLLELYLNLIEWGPGLYGLGPAARHYLGKDARALTPREACFLATLIPSPLRSHAALLAGAPAARWSDRIDDLLRKLGAAGVLDEAALARELAAPLALASWIPGAVSPGAAAPQGGAPELGASDGEAPDDDPPAAPSPEPSDR